MWWILVAFILGAAVCFGVVLFIGNRLVKAGTEEDNRLVLENEALWDVLEAAQIDAPKGVDYARAVHHIAEEKERNKR